MSGDGGRQLEYYSVGDGLRHGCSGRREQVMLKARFDWSRRGLLYGGVRHGSLSGWGRVYVRGYEV